MDKGPALLIALKKMRDGKEGNGRDDYYHKTEDRTNEEGGSYEDRVCALEDKVEELEMKLNELMGNKELPKQYTGDDGDYE